MRRPIVVSGVFALFALLACDKDKGAEPTAVAPPVAASAAPVAAASAAVAPVVAASAAAAPASDTIPVAADFEEEAEKSITKANYKAELDSLEAELK
jgi:hypothetical protein